jgi:hypothetical protein
MSVATASLFTLSEIQRVSHVRLTRMHDRETYGDVRKERERQPEAYTTRRVPGHV